MQAISKHEIWVTRPGQPAVIEAVQGQDTARVAELVIRDLAIPEDATATIYAALKGDARVYNLCERVSADTIRVPLTATMLAYPGIRSCQVRVQLGNEIITSFPIKLRVAPSVVDDAAIEGTSEYTALETMQARLDDYTEEAARSAAASAQSAQAAQDSATAAAQSAAIAEAAIVHDTAGNRLTLVLDAAEGVIHVREVI